MCALRASETIGHLHLGAATGGTAPHRDGRPDTHCSSGPLRIVRSVPSAVVGGKAGTRKKTPRAASLRTPPPQREVLLEPVRYLSYRAPEPWPPGSDHVAPRLNRMPDGAEGEARGQAAAEAEQAKLLADRKIAGIHRQRQRDRRARG